MGVTSSSETLQKIYKEVLGDYADDKAFLWKHRGGFVHYVQTAIDSGLLGAGMGRKYFKLEKLSYSLDPSRDHLLTAKDATTLVKNYLLKDDKGRILEVPQYFWMRVAMSRSTLTSNPTRAALALYNGLSLNPQTTLLTTQ